MKPLKMPLAFVLLAQETADPLAWPTLRQEHKP